MPRRDKWIDPPSRVCCVPQVSIEEIRHAAKQAVAGVVAEFQAHQATALDRRMRDQIVRWALGVLSLSLSANGRELAEQEAAAALESCPWVRPVMNCSTRGIGR